MYRKKSSKLPLILPWSGRSPFVQFNPKVMTTGAFFFSRSIGRINSIHFSIYIKRLRSISITPHSLYKLRFVWIVIALRFFYCVVFIHQKILRSQHTAARYNPKEPQSAVFAHLTDAVVCVRANNICIDAVTNDMAVYNYFKTKPLCILLGCHNFPIALNAMATTTRTWTRRQRWRQMVVGCGGKTNDFGFGFGAPRHAFPYARDKCYNFL